MTVSGDAQQRIEAYLGRLRQRFRGMNAEDAREIVEELRSHLMDRLAACGDATAADVDAALAALGSPEALASEYMTDKLLARAEVSRSPVRIMESLFRWASLSVAGFFVLVGSVTGYFLGSVFILVAALKPFHPQTAGLWLLPDSTGGSEISIRLGFGTVPAAGREILSWWIVPIGLLAGCAVLMLTTRFALWCARQYRRSHLLPQD
jgi:HAAS domain-containing protein